MTPPTAETARDAAATAPANPASTPANAAAAPTAVTGPADAPSGAPSGAAADSHSAAPAFRVVQGNPTDAELAAVTAVLLATLRARRDAAAARPRPVGQTSWQRSQRGLRGPHVAGAGRWRGFGS